MHHRYLSDRVERGSESKRIDRNPLVGSRLKTFDGDGAFQSYIFSWFRGANIAGEVKVDQNKGLIWWSNDEGRYSIGQFTIDRGRDERGRRLGLRAADMNRHGA